MIYAQNQGITGINIHRKIIDRVYKGNRLVWLRDSTADYFTIVGDDYILASKSKTYRVKYSGSDDVSYSWTFSGIFPERIIYNHNKRKVSIKTNINDDEKTLVITCVMTRKNKSPLTATKTVNILPYVGIINFDIEQDIICNVAQDTSTYANFYIYPEDYAPDSSVVSVSLSDDYATLSNATPYGVSIDHGIRDSSHDSSLYASVTDNIIVDAPDYEIVDSISEASGDYDHVYATDTGKWYEKNNNGLYEEYGILETVDSLSNATCYIGKLVVLSTNTHEYKWNGNTWVDLGYTPQRVYAYSTNGAWKAKFKYYWNTGYKMVVSYYKIAETVRSSGFISADYTSPIVVYFDSRTVKSQLLKSTSQVDNTTSYNGNNAGISTYTLDNAHLYKDLEITIDDFTLKDSSTHEVLGTTTYSGEHITSPWYEGLYEGTINLNNTHNVRLTQIKVYNQYGVLVNDISAILNTTESVANRISFYDRINHETYQNTTSVVPSYTLTDDVIPIEVYEPKPSPATDKEYVHTDRGWIIVHHASSTVHFFKYKPTEYFTIDSSSVGSGYCMKGRMRVGIVYSPDMYVETPPTINSVNIGSNIDPFEYGLYKATYNGNGYGRYGLSKNTEIAEFIMKNKGAVYWIEYNNGEDKFIPPFISSFDDANTWAFYKISTGDGDVTGSVDVTNPSYSDFNTDLDKKFTNFVMRVRPTDSTATSVNLVMDYNRSSYINID